MGSGAPRTQNNAISTSPRDHEARAIRLARQRWAAYSWDLVVVFTTLSVGLQDFYGLQMGCTAQLREDERIISPAASANAAAIPR